MPAVELSIVVLTCDKCSKSHTFVDSNVGAVSEKVKKEGWKVGCPKTCKLECCTEEIEFSMCCKNDEVICKDCQE